MIKTFKELARVNTGRSFLDSGDYYGRQYDKGPIPDSQPLEYAIPDGPGRFMFLISTAQLLDTHLEIDAPMTRLFNRMTCSQRSNWIELAQGFVSHMVETGRWESMDDDPIGALNTYNWDNDLDQIFQVAASTGYYGEWHLIQMHNGCDVRGGYTAPVVATGCLEDVLCSDRIEAYCSRCQEGADSLYQAEEKGWKFRSNRRSVSLVCPTCRRVAFSLPLQDS